METETTLTTTDRVRSIIAAYLERDVADNVTDLETDSLENIEIAMDIEERLGLDNIDDDAAIACKSVADFLALVEGAMK